MFSARIIEDSCHHTSDDSRRLTSVLLTYPRFIHAEFMTHRMFSRNASSSRAIPVEKQIAMIEQQMACPIFWGKNQKGMQAVEELDADSMVKAKQIWLMAAHAAIGFAKELIAIDAHKQIVNRVLEPYAHITVVATGTGRAFRNLFALRCHKDAQPEFQALAYMLRDEYTASRPKVLSIGEWHLPFIKDAERATLNNEVLMKCSAARCARTSFLNHDQTNPTVANDLKLFERLAGGIPLHASPLEHQATPGSDPRLFGNFPSWHQFRKFLSNECAP